MTARALVITTVAVRGQIVSVTDGDTLRIRIGGRSERVRLLGIDTPETHRPGVSVECGGRQATAYMRRFARPRARDARATVTTDPTQDRRDRYDRLLAYVDVKGEGDAAAAIVHKGSSQDKAEKSISRR